MMLAKQKPAEPRSMLPNYNELLFGAKPEPSRPPQPYAQIKVEPQYTPPKPMVHMQVTEEFFPNELDLNY